MKLYHGSPKQGITEFCFDNPRYQSVEGAGVYLTNDYRVARGYAGSEGAVYVCELKPQAIFDATDPAEFTGLLARIGKDINFDVTSLDSMAVTIAGLVSGQYQITNEQGTGLNWQIRNVLINDENFCSLPDADEKLERIEQMVNEYMSEHSVLKYVDKLLGLVFVCRDASALKITGEVAVGSDDELPFL
jgi:hypothetical protein